MTVIRTGKYLPLSEYNNKNITNPDQFITFILFRLPILCTIRIIYVPILTHYFMQQMVGVNMGNRKQQENIHASPWIYNVVFHPYALNIYCEKTDFVPERNRKL